MAAPTALHYYVLARRVGEVSRNDTKRRATSGGAACAAIRRQVAAPTGTPPRGGVLWRRHWRRHPPPGHGALFDAGVTRVQARAHASIRRRLIDVELKTLGERARELARNVLFDVRIFQRTTKNCKRRLRPHWKFNRRARAPPPESETSSPRCESLARTPPRAVRAPRGHPRRFDAASRSGAPR